MEYDSFLTQYCKFKDVLGTSELNINTMVVSSWSTRFLAKLI